jgi:WD40 repeat protein
MSIYSKCLAVLQGHTSLVGQLQMRDDTLVTGGSDGSVRVWSLVDYQAIHRLAAHDNSVTSLQFDNTRIVSGGSDGRVKVWDTKKGTLVRELSQPAEAVWRVVFEEEKAVIMASRGGRTIMEVSYPLKAAPFRRSRTNITAGVVLLTKSRRTRRLPLVQPSEHARSRHRI